MADRATDRAAATRRGVALIAATPPQVYFLISAVFHYLGPAFAVLLFDRVSVLGVAWLRIASAAVVFAVWQRPWRSMLRQPWARQRLLVAFGVVLAAMNTCFYLAIDRLPLGTVGAIEFLGPIGLAALGARRRRNLLALGLAVGGVWLLTDVRLAGEPLGFAFAFANSALFVFYVVLGHRLAREGGERIGRLGAAMLVALVVATPIGMAGAAPTFVAPELLAAGIAVGLCSSVIPYVCDQLAMARLSRSTFALLLSLLPASAAAIGFIVLRQEPRPLEIVAIGLIVAGVAVHEEPSPVTNDARHNAPGRRWASTRDLGDGDGSFATLRGDADRREPAPRAAGAEEVADPVPAAPAGSDGDRPGLRRH